MSAPASFGSECVTIDGKQYCVKEETKVGGAIVKITNPEALLRAAKASKKSLRRTGLYDDYYFVPVVEELARQNNMDYHQFIAYMVVNWTEMRWNPFKTLYELERVYDDIPVEYRGQTMDWIVYAIVADIENALT